MQETFVKPGENIHGETCPRLLSKTEVGEVRGNPCECVSMEAEGEFFRNEGVVFELKATERLSKMRMGKAFISFRIGR